MSTSPDRSDEGDQRPRSKRTARSDGEIFDGPPRTRSKRMVEMPIPGRRMWCGCIGGDGGDPPPVERRCMICGRRPGEAPEAKPSDAAKSAADDGDDNWYAAMFSRKKDSTGTRPERTSIRATPHVEEILNARDGGADRAPRRSRGSVDDPGDAVRITNSGWNLIVIIGPMTLDKVTEVCAMWSKSGQDCQRGMVAKVARGEAIANCMSVPGYVDWEKVFDTDGKKVSSDQGKK
jgi:hypothetical protein